MSAKIKANDGDWICQAKGSNGQCGNLNFSSRSKCNKCGTEIQKEWIYKKAGAEIGKQHAEKTGGLFSADDWMCKSCGNINWARRVKCNVCNTSKLAKVENRTGLGGGFKDRDDVVEYKEREESDDEFDEFGLKKKKFRGNNPESENSKGNGQDDQSYEKHDDDSELGEEEEEGDLDKYNLLDEDDVEDLVEAKATRERTSPREDETNSSSSRSSDESSSGGSSSSSDSDSDSSSGSQSSSDTASSASSTSDHRRRKDRNRTERNRSRSRSPLDKRHHSRR